VLREHLVALSGRVDLLPGAEAQVFIDIDSLLRPVTPRQARRLYGHTKIAGRRSAQGTLAVAATISKTAPRRGDRRLRLRAADRLGQGRGRIVAQRSAPP